MNTVFVHEERSVFLWLGQQSFNRFVIEQQFEPFNKIIFLIIFPEETMLVTINVYMNTTQNLQNKP